MIKKAAAAVAAVGFAIILGTAGASDAAVISLGQTVAQVVLGGVLMGAGMGVIWYIERGE